MHQFSETELDLIARCARAETEVGRLRARLDMIAGIAEGSTTANSLPHIAKIARGVDEQKARVENG